MITLADDALRARISDGSLPPTQFGHREHVRLAWTYLAEKDDFALAAEAFRSALRRYASAVGAHGKYHETLTWAWLALIREAMEGRDDATSAELLASRPELLEQDTLARIYDVPAIVNDPLARRIFVLPRAQMRESAEMRDRARAGT